MMWTPDVCWWQLIIRGLVVYASILLCLRFAGKRQIGQLGMPEFVTLMLVSNAVQNAMNGGDNSISGGLILALTLIATTYLVDKLTYRFRWLDRLIQGSPVVVITRGVVQKENLRRHRITEHALRAMLREQGHYSIEKIDLAILESDGRLSVKCKE